MKLENTPLRILVKQYASGLIDREQYLLIRARLLQRLETRGKLSQRDLEQLSKDLGKPPETSESHYSASDWVITLLGVAAAIALGVILYS